MRLGATIDRRKEYSLVQVLASDKPEKIIGYAILRPDGSVFAEYDELASAVLSLHDVARYAGLDTTSRGDSGSLQ